MEESCAETYVKKKSQLTLNNILLEESATTQKATNEKVLKRRRKRFFDFDNAVVEDVINGEEYSSQSTNILNANLNNCSWLITGPVNKTLNLTMINFTYKETSETKKRRKRFSFDDLVPEDVYDGEEETAESPRFEPCVENFIEVFDGSNSNAPKIGDKICGDSGSKFLESSGNSLFVVYSFPVMSALDELRIGYNLGGTIQ